MKRLLIMAALLFAPAASGQTCEELRAGKALMSKTSDSLIAEAKKTIKEMENSRDNHLAGKLDNAQARRDLEKAKAWQKEKQEQYKAVLAIMDALFFTAKAKGCL